jgi:hypothetical protein
MGEGVAGQALDPAPAPIARTSQMLGDDYLFWRVSEGGAHFSTAMPAWEVALDEQTRWDLINYIQVLGTGQTAGKGLDPVAEAALHAEMVAAGVEQNLFSQAEGDIFLTVHALLDEAMAANPGQRGSGTMMDQQSAVLASLVETGTLTQADADTFVVVRDQIINAGLMQ